MAENTNEAQVSLKKLKQNELICAVLGLLLGIIAFIFLFVDTIVFNETLVDDISMQFTTHISRFLSSDFGLYYGDISIPIWEFCNPGLNLENLEQLIRIYFAVLSWFMLIGSLLSVLFFILFLCKIRLYWLSEFAARMAAISGIFILLSLIVGQISISGDRIYLESVNYNIAIPIIYSIVMAGLCIAVSRLLKYSQKRQEILKDIRTKQEMEAAVGAAPSVDTETTPAPMIQAAPLTEDSAAPAIPSTPAPAPAEAAAAAPASALVVSVPAPVPSSAPVPTPAPTPVNAGADYNAPVTAAAKQAVLAKFQNALSPSGMTSFAKYIETLTADQYQRLMQMPIKKKVTTILLAIFLGGIGIDRFYVGDVKLGVFKIVGSVAASLMILIPILGTIASIANAIWKFADIFISYKKIYDKNYENAMAILGKR